MKNVDLEPTGQSYFDSQKEEYERIIENGRRFMNKCKEEELITKCQHEFISREYESQPYGTCFSCGITVFT